MPKVIGQTSTPAVLRSRRNVLNILASIAAVAAIPAAARAMPPADPVSAAMGFYASWPGITGAGVDVSNQPIPVGAAMTYSSATATHEGIDLLADSGVLKRRLCWQEYCIVSF